MMVIEKMLYETVKTVISYSIHHEIEVLFPPF